MRVIIAQVFEGHITFDWDISRIEGGAPFGVFSFGQKRYLSFSWLPPNWHPPLLALLTRPSELALPYVSLSSRPSYHGRTFHQPLIWREHERFPIGLGRHDRDRTLQTNHPRGWWNWLQNYSAMDFVRYVQQSKMTDCSRAWRGENIVSFSSSHAVRRCRCVFETFIALDNENFIGLLRG